MLEYLPGLDHVTELTSTLAFQAPEEDLREWAIIWRLGRYECFHPSRFFQNGGIRNGPANHMRATSCQNSNAPEALIGARHNSYFCCILEKGNSCNNLTKTVQFC